PRQERGHRPTRPLRYAPSVDAKAGSGALTLTFASGAHAGGAFLVTTPGVTPRSYTTGAGKKISDTFTGASYDLTVHGPAGFLRTFKGETAHAGPEVVARHVGDCVELTFTNTSKDTVELRVTDAYRSRTTTVKLRPHAVLKRTVETGKGHRWYDLTVTSHASSTFLRRFAGHVENGRPGVSDPAIITE
ncbi:phospholipase domain-containing protein, partial [Streptomyces niveiscabiei]